MRNLFTQKKFLFLALLEDMLFIIFLFTLLTSSLEIMLPGIITNRLPLAFLFTFLALLWFLYAYWKQKEGLVSLPSLPLLVLIPLGILLLLITLFMARDFGLWGALVQTLLMIAVFFYWITEKKK